MEGLRIFAASAVSAAALNAAAPAEAQFKLIGPFDPDMHSQITLERMLDFEAEVKLSVRTDPRLVPTERALELVRSIDMRDGNGIRITSGYTIDAQHNVAIAWSGGSVEITRLRQSPAGLGVTGCSRIIRADRHPALGQHCRLHDQWRAHLFRDGERAKRAARRAHELPHPVGCVGLDGPGDR
jgi:hypothetical protein